MSKVNIPEAAPEDGGEETIVIRTTASKLRQAEIQLLGIQNLNEVPESLGKYSLRACIFQFTQAIFLFYLASKSGTEWKLFTSYPLPERDALSHPPLEPDTNEIVSYSILWYSPLFILMYVHCSVGTTVP